MAGSSKASATKRSAPDEGKVRLKLAHPIGPPYQAGLGLEVKEDDYKVGEDVDLWPHVARAVINAGYAQVDPEKPGDVAKALGISDEEAERVVEEMAGENPPKPAPDNPPSP